MVYVAFSEGTIGHHVTQLSAPQDLMRRLIKPNQPLKTPETKRTKSKVASISSRAVRCATERSQGEGTSFIALREGPATSSFTKCS